MALRYDFVQVSSPRIDAVTGILRCRGTIARTGIQEYRNADGSVRREFRPPDEVEKSAKSFETQPITLEHPPEMVNSSNSRQYMRGLSGPVHFDGVLLTTDLTVTDHEAIQAAQTTHRQISNGYECDIDNTPGFWEGEKYDCVQRNIRGNHVALVEKARAGDVARLHFDSATGEGDIPEDRATAVRSDGSDSEIPVNCVLVSPQGNTNEHIPLTRSATKSISKNRPRMANLHIDSVEFNDVPEALAAQVSNKLLRLVAETARADSSENELEAARQEVQGLKDQLEESIDLKERERGRADQLEVQIEDLNYQIENAEVKTDSAEAEPESRLDEDEALTAIATGIQEGISSRIEAYEVLEQHGVDLSDIEFPHSYTPSQVQEAVLELVQPGVTFDSVDESVRPIYILARYDAIKGLSTIEPEVRNDSEGFVAGARGSITQTRKQGAGKGASGEIDEGCQNKMDAHTRPLSVSKSR